MNRNGFNYAAMLSEAVRANILRARQAKGWSQQKLALMCDPPTVYQQIDKLETGERRLTLDWIERIADALGYSAIELISGTPPETRPAMSEPVATEVARTLLRTALCDETPDAGTLQVLSIMLREFAGIFRRYPQALTDPEVARPVLEFAARQLSQQAS